MFLYDGELPEELAQEIGLPFDRHLAATFDFYPAELALNDDGQLSQRQIYLVRGRIGWIWPGKYLLLGALLIPLLFLSVVGSTWVFLLLMLATVPLHLNWWRQDRPLRQALAGGHVQAAHGRAVLLRRGWLTPPQLIIEGAQAFPLTSNQHTIFKPGAVYNVYYVPGINYIVSAMQISPAEATNKLAQSDLAIGFSRLLPATGDDLQANRSGVLSDAQRQRIRQQSSHALLNRFTALTPLLIVQVSILAVVTVWSALVFITFAALMTATVFLSVWWLSNHGIRLYDALCGEVQQVRGNPQPATDRRSVVLQGKRLEAPPEVVARLKASNDPVTLYYLPRRRYIISAEV